jgi:hypothetical protein
MKSVRGSLCSSSAVFDITVSAANVAPAYVHGAGHPYCPGSQQRGNNAAAVAKVNQSFPAFCQTIKNIGTFTAAHQSKPYEQRYMSKPRHIFTARDVYANN